jgi:hypothetical protein
MSKQTDLINIPDAITVSGSNVGIGTSSPDANLSLKSPIYTSGGTGNGIRFQNQNNNADAVIQSYYSGTSTSALLHGSNSYLSTSASFTAFDSSKASSYVLQNTNGAIEFGNNTSGNPTERMQIDSSGNVLVGRTSLSGTDNSSGSYIYNEGAFVAQRSSNVSLYLNRFGTDGDIALFRKNGTTVGSIGTNGSTLYIGSTEGADAHLGFGNQIIRPVTSSGASRDNAIDLGYNGMRFRDLYLSGGIHLGGVGSANKLDDYETGTFTLGFAGATVSPANTTATYIKIGNLVNWFYYSGSTTISSSSAYGRITGLPFTVLGGGYSYIPVTIAHNRFFNGSTSEGQHAYHLTGDTKVVFNTIGQGNNPSFVNGTGKSIMLQGSYYTNS